MRALVCAPNCARAGDGGRVPPPPQPRPPLSNARRKSLLPPPLHPAHPLLPHFLLLSLLLRAHSRTLRSSRWPSWESLAATAQLALAVPPVLGHLLEAQSRCRGLARRGREGEGVCISLHVPAGCVCGGVALLRLQFLALLESQSQEVASEAGVPNLGCRCGEPGSWQILGLNGQWEMNV